MRTVVCLCVVVVAALPAFAQQRRIPVDPVELSGPPKKVPVVLPGIRAAAENNLLSFDNKDPKAVARAVTELTTLIEKYPDESDLYFIRATTSCQNNGGRDGILSDVSTALKLRATSGSLVDETQKDAVALKAKAEFDLGRFQDAMDDLDAAIAADYAGAEHIFNDGNVKPNEPVAPCMWAMKDLNKLAELFPKDARPPLFLGLYLLQFSHYSLDFDFEPVFKAFEHSAQLNPSSPLPAYYTGEPYVVGGIGGMLSKARSMCNENAEPRTKDCLSVDELHRTGVRWLTKAIAADQKFEPAYELRATAHYQLKEYRQAIRDFDAALELNPNANVYNDRAMAKEDLRDYEGAILDYTKAIARKCDTGWCPSYENRANLYLKLHDYQHAIIDIGHAIKNFLSDTSYIINIDQFRRMYPEYDDMADDLLCEKVRALFNPQMTYANFSKQFLVEAKEFNDFILPGFYLKRGDAYADMGETAKANREYDRVSKGFPKWAENAFRTENGKRIRIRF